MYFNLWNDYFYYKKSVIVIVSIFLVILFSTYIIIKWFSQYLERKEKRKYIFMSIEWKDLKEKFETLKKILDLNSSYQIASFIKLDIKKTEDLIKQNQFEQIVNLILKNI